jgi:chromatin assembly factor 1 subunit B
MSSSDGYCSTLAFAPGELGQVYTGAHPTHNHPVISTSISLPTSAGNTPLPTPTATASPSLTKASPILQPPSHPSPAPTFSVRPGSPTRSNSQSSIATMTSIQTSQMTNNPTPTLGHVPLATAMNSAPPVAIPPMTTPPQTPASTHGGGHHSATSSVSGSVLGKRDLGAASESEKEEGKAKKRRVAPTLVGPSRESAVNLPSAERKESTD